MSKKSEFVQTIYQAGLDAGLTDAAARVMAAQAAHESGYGESSPGFNYFGIKAGKSWEGKTQSLATHEVVNGKRVKTKANFRAYGSPEEAIADRIAFMADKFPEFNSAETTGEALDALLNGKFGKYYTDDQSKYEGSINFINANFLDGAPVPPRDIGDGGESNSGILRQGSKGDDVYGLQTLLESAGFSPGTIDGDFGKKTEAALRAYQEANSLKVDGLAGPKTFASFVQTPQAPAATPSPVVSVAQTSNGLVPGQGLRLASGKTIAAGVYPASGGRQVRVSDDGSGNARIEPVRGPGAIPGVLDPSREMNADTMAGGFIRRVTPAIVQEGLAAAPGVANELIAGAKSGAAQALESAAANEQGLKSLASVVPGGQLLSLVPSGGIGGLWDSVRKSVAPPSPETRLLSLVSSPKALSDDVGSGPSWTGLQTERMLAQPTSDPVLAGPKWGELQAMATQVGGNALVPTRTPAAARPAAPIVRPRPVMAVNSRGETPAQARARQIAEGKASQLDEFGMIR